jgi:DNA-binding CsgD family transcriptional regulator
MAVQQALGRSGTLMPGNVFRIGMPRSDLNVTVEGVPVRATFALGSYAAFRPLDDGSGQAMVMGDLVLRDEEVPGVMSGLFDNGLQATALHNHVNQVAPHVMYLHYEGMGDPVQLAAGLHSALGASGTPLGAAPAAGRAGRCAGPLTAREWEVAGLIARGLTNPQIAERLVITTRTVAAHVEHILDKLGFASRHQVAAWAAEHGLLT